MPAPSPDAPDAPKDPDPRSKQAVTQLLIEARGGNSEALNELMPLVYDELRELAHEKLRHERAGHTLGTTALVHEAYLRLVNQREVEWQSRSHFFALAAQAMRRILVNYAEKHKAEKRGGGTPDVPLERAMKRGEVVFSAERIEQILGVDHALDRLATFNERGCRVVEYRFFGGLTHREVAEVMGLSVSTVRRAWSASKAWLRREMGGGNG